MDIQSIILILLALIVGGVTVWIVVRQKTVATTIAKDSQISNLQSEIAELKGENSNLMEENVKANALFKVELEAKESELKTKYEALIQQINEENSKLDTALKLATEGKIDESTQIRLLQAEKSARAIKEMENQLAELRAQHSKLLSEHGPLRESLEQANAKCETMTKKIKKLEDEIDDAEEEQEALEKKLKNKTSELQESQDQLDKSNRENKRLAENLSQREDELANKIEELKRKNESIEFVHEILTAKEPSGQNIKKLNQSINYLESFIKGQFMDCNTYLYNTYNDLSYNGISGLKGFNEKKTIISQMLTEWVAVKRKSWLDNKTTIAFVGEFSAGKTSIVNRILSQDNPKIPRLPVSTKATTAIPTYIAGDSYETYSFISPDGKRKLIDEKIFKKISKEVLD